MKNADRDCWCSCSLTKNKGEINGILFFKLQQLESPFTQKDMIRRLNGHKAVKEHYDDRSL